MKLFQLLLTVILATTIHAQKVNELIRSGNEWYRKGQFDQAEKEYKQAVTAQPANGTAQFNMANAIYKQGKKEEAVKNYRIIAGISKNPALQSNALFNAGAIHSKDNKLEESIVVYKNALKLDPGNKEARENLQKALLELKKKEPPKQKEDDKKKKQDQQKKQQQQPQMNKREAEQRLKLLEQKEKEVQQRLQKERSRNGGGQEKDW